MIFPKIRAAVKLGTAFLATIAAVL